MIAKIVEKIKGQVQTMKTFLGGTFVISKRSGQGIKVARVAWVKQV